jgi:hypothetical protein
MWLSGRITMRGHNTHASVVSTFNTTMLKRISDNTRLQHVFHSSESDACSHIKRRETLAGLKISFMTKFVADYLTKSVFVLPVNKNPTCFNAVLDSFSTSRIVDNNVFWFIMLTTEYRCFEVQHISRWRTWKHKSGSLQIVMNNTGTLLRVVCGISPHKRSTDITAKSNTRFMTETLVRQRSAWQKRLVWR